MKLILAVDDEPGIYEICKHSLTRKGYSVSTALSGNEAIELLKTENFDMALVDLRMPEGDGFELLKVLRKSSPATKIIIVSAETTLQTAIDCLKWGALDYIMKPFDLDELLGRIDRAFKYGPEIFGIRASHKELFECLSERLKADHSKHHVLSIILEQASQTLQACAGHLFDVESPGGALRHVHSLGYGTAQYDRHQLCKCITDWLSLNRQPALIHGDLADIPQFRLFASEYRFCASMLLPLVRHHELLGFLSLHKLEGNAKDRRFTPTDFETGKHFALYAELILSMQYQNKYQPD